MLRRIFRAIRPASNHPAPADTKPSALPPADPLYEAALREYEEGKLDASARMLEQVIGSRHDFARAHFLLGEIHRRRGEPEDALDCYMLANSFDPGLSNAHAQRGRVLYDQRRFAEALEAWQQADKLAPGDAAVSNLVGAAFMALGRFDEAAAMFRRALELDPKSPAAHSNLGHVLLRYFEEVEQGAAHIEEALQLAPQHFGALCNKVMALQYHGRFPEALALSERLLAHGAGDQMRLNRGLMLLMVSDFGRGWDEYEARKLIPDAESLPTVPFPEWLGEPLAGKTILVQAEQGLGDQIMFASCLSDLAAAAKRCIVQSDARLVPLFRRSFPWAQCFEVCEGPQGWERAGLKPDVHVSMGSLPRFLRRDLASFPRHAGYLKVDESRVRSWKERLAKLPGQAKVAISWRGGMRATRRRLRSIPLDEWAPVLRVPGIDFVSIQYSDCRDEIERAEGLHGIKLWHWQEAIDDYEETAALVAAVDLVISVQTAAVHLAGALGQTVWALIGAIPEWRYLATGDAMPWYPSVRLMRQRAMDDWSPTLAQVAEALAAWRSAARSSQ